MSIRTQSTTTAGGTGGPPREPPYPWRLFVGMLLVILVGGAVLAVALGLNPLSSRTPDVSAVATPIGTGPTLVPTTTPVARPTPLVIPTTAPAAASTAVSTPAPTPATAAGPQTVPTPGATSTTAATEPTTAVVGATVEPTPIEAAVAPDLAAAIIQGYDNYWSVRVQASGDPNNASLDLASVMADGELQAANKTLDQYRQEGVAFRTTVDHQIWITNATPTDAIVVDRYSGQSLRLSLDSKQPDGSDPVSESFEDMFFLRNIDGVWKVVNQQPVGAGR